MEHFICDLTDRGDLLDGFTAGAFVAVGMEIPRDAKCIIRLRPDQIVTRLLFSSLLTGIQNFELEGDDHHVTTRSEFKFCKSTKGVWNSDLDYKSLLNISSDIGVCGPTLHLAISTSACTAST